MSTDPSPPQNRFEPPKWVVWTLVCIGLATYWWLYFSQTSVLGLTDAQGQALNRFADLMQILLPEQQLDSMLGSGRLQVNVLDRIPLVLAISVWLGVACAVGWPWVEQVGWPQPLTFLERFCLATLSGLSLLSTLTLLVGLCGGLSNRWPLLLAIVSCVGCAAALTLRNRKRRQTLEPLLLRSLPERLPAVVPDSVLSMWLMRLIPVGTCLLGGLLLLGCLMPPWEFDVVEYHLQAPKEFFQQGAIRFNDHNIYANMPLAAEMHALASMTLYGGDDGWWWGGLIGKGITGTISILAAGLLGGFVSRYCGRWIGWGAAACLLSSPGNAHVAMAGLIDMVLAAYLLAAVVVASELRSAWKGEQVSFSGLFLTCLLAGSAAACKYTGLIFVTLPMLLYSLWVIFYFPRFNWRSLSCVAVAISAGMIVSWIPWYAKNIVWTGNPVYPLASRLFGAGGLSAAQIEQWQTAHRVPGVNSHGPYSLVALAGSVQQVLVQSSFLQPSLMALFLIGAVVIFRGWSSRADSRRPQLANAPAWGTAWLGMTLWIGAVWWLATHRIERFWLPALPLLCAVSSLGVSWLGRRLSSSLAAGVLLLGMFYGGFMMVSGALGDNRFFVSLNALRSDAGSDDQPGRLTQATGWANEHLADNAGRLLLIGEAKAYDFRMPIVYSTCFNRSPAEDWLQDRSPAQQRANLKKAGVTHVMVNWSELARYRSPGNYGFSVWPQRDDLRELVENDILRSVTTPFDSESVGIWEVVTEETEPEPNALLSGSEPSY